MKELLFSNASDLLEKKVPVSETFLVTGSTFWILFFLVCGLILGRKLFQTGRQAVSRLEQENSRDMIRLENYRSEIDIQSSSPVLQRSESEDEDLPTGFRISRFTNLTS